MCRIVFARQKNRANQCSLVSLQAAGMDVGGSQSQVSSEEPLRAVSRPRPQRSALRYSLLKSSPETQQLPVKSTQKDTKHTAAAAAAASSGPTPARRQLSNTAGCRYRGRRPGRVAVQTRTQSHTCGLKKRRRRRRIQC